MKILNAALGKLAQGLRLGHLARHAESIADSAKTIASAAIDMRQDVKGARFALEHIANKAAESEKCRREQSMAEQALLAKTVRFYEELSRRLESFEALKHAEVATLQANAERLPELKEPAAKLESQPCSSALGMVFR